MKPGVRQDLIDGGTAGEEIKRSVMSWPGVEAVPHRFGGTEYRFGRKEMGHVHGDRLADLPLPRRLHDEVIADGRAQPHHVLPDTGWVSCWIERPEDVTTVIDLLRLQYERYRAAAVRSDSATGSVERSPS
jgi:hypothetical protein